MAPQRRTLTARVLIVDDSEVDLMIGRRVLENAGHQVLYAQDGEVALSVLQIHEIDIVVTDLVMPNMNGHVLIEKLRSENPRMPIVAVSGESPEMLERVKEHGAIVTLKKPFSPDQLLLAVDLAVRVAEQRSLDELAG